MIIKNEHVKFKTVKLKDVLTIKNGKSQKKIEDESGIYGIYGTGGLMGNTNSYIGEEKSIIIGRKGTIDSPLFMKEKYWVIDTAFYTDNFLYDSKYLYYIIKRINFHNYSKSAVIPSLTKNDLNEIDILVTEDFSYAKKISLYLDKEFSRLEKINILLKKIEIRNQYYADKILSGELRLNKNILELKHNEDYEYEKLKISDICEISTGKKDANEGSEDGVYEFFTCSLENKKINSYSYDEEAILITGNGDPGVCKYFNGKFDAYQRVYILRNIKINPKYFYCVLRSYFKDSIQNSKVGGVIQYIRLNDISDFEFRYPKNYDINKILVFLDKLNDEKEKVEKLLKLEEQRFEWLSDKLLSGEYIIED